MNTQEMRPSIEVSRKDDFHFYRCGKCFRLLTLVEERLGYASKEGFTCPCGSARYSPTNPKWFEMFQPRVFWFLAMLVFNNPLALTRSQVEELARRKGKSRA